MSKGSIKVNTENLLPIIKKWLYSDKDIFLRELVSNAQDAVMKLKKLAAIGEANIADSEDFRIDVIVNKTAKTLKVCDNGIGMTADEVDKYINQVAFSGAEDFIAKYENSKVLDFILRLWCQRALRLTLFHMRTAQKAFTGKATAVRNLTLRTAQRKTEEQLSRFI